MLLHWYCTFRSNYNPIKTNFSWELTLRQDRRRGWNKCLLLTPDIPVKIWEMHVQIGNCQLNFRSRVFSLQMIDMQQIVIIKIKHSEFVVLWLEFRKELQSFFIILNLLFFIQLCKLLRSCNQEPQNRVTKIPVHPIVPRFQLNVSLFTDISHGVLFHTYDSIGSVILCGEKNRIF